ncbi:manganese and iron superoxide dismutase [Ceraceosorus guamensis]|uniref:Superoxide dismutase n=2 Tax=Ceraceosorus TaxID=401624 RepID=A0A316W5X1_9BASI|nr:manganese and iron superoxide dismutase [Ceraceosorus guamensis]PWN43055.1 manganese and iron superoxide dismutase [Ceraceosorus guamensis]
MLARTALGRIAAVAPTANAGSRLGLASMSMGVRSKHTLPDLPYDFGALEPSISGQIMELHHQKHHQTYVNGLNQAEETLANAVAKNDVKAAIATQKALNFNGGGHVNHSLFWQNLAPSKQGGGELSAGPLKEAIERDFGSLDGLKSKFNAQLAGIQGSGWGWLGLNPSTGKLDIITTANQDPLLSHVPLIGVDAWEHAFYLQYQNVKADYFKAIWNVINFKTAEERLKQAQ